MNDVYQRFLLHLCGFPGGASGKEPAANAGDKRGVGLIPGSGKSLRGGHAIHSSTLAWEILWTKEPGMLQSVASQRVGCD